MLDIIESNPEILGGKPIIKDTRISVALINELIGLNYIIEEIQEKYSYLNRQIILKLMELGNDVLKNLSQVNLDDLLSKEDHYNLRFLLDENVPLSIKKLIKELEHKAITLREDKKIDLRE